MSYFANFNIIIDSKKTSGQFVDKKLLSSLPETLFFTAGVYETAIVHVWTNFKTADPIYVHCSIIETQIVGNKWEKCLFVILPFLDDVGASFTISGVHHQYKKIFEHHVSKIDFSFFYSDGRPVEFETTDNIHMIMNLNIRKRWERKSD